MDSKLLTFGAACLIVAGLITTGHASFAARSARDVLQSATPASGAVVRHSDIRCVHKKRYTTCSVPVIASAADWTGRVVLATAKTQHDAQEALDRYTPGASIPLHRVTQGGQTRYLGAHDLDQLKHEASGPSKNAIALALVLFATGLGAAFSINREHS